MNPRGMGRTEQYKIEVVSECPGGHADAILYKHHAGHWTLSFSCGLQRADEGSLLCLIALAARAEEIARPKTQIDFQI